MKIVVDERERDLYQALYAFIHSQMTPLPLQLEKEVLPLGDISIRRDEDDKEWVLLERKTLKDLVSSIKDGRYEEQSYRLTHSTPADFQLHNICYLIEGPLNTIRNPIERKMILGAMASLYFFKGFQVMRTSSVEDTAEWIATLALKMERGMAEKKMPWFLRWDTPSQSLSQPTPSPLTTNNQPISPTVQPIIDTQTPIPNPETETQEREPDKAYCTVVKRTKGANVTPENIGEIILCQIPSVGPETALSIMYKYNQSLAALVHDLETQGPSCLESLSTLDGKGRARKISKACIANVHRFLVNNREENTKEST
jgi:ERCC4-type nuclease